MDLSQCRKTTVVESAQLLVESGFAMVSIGKQQFLPVLCSTPNPVERLTWAKLQIGNWVDRTVQIGIFSKENAPFSRFVPGL